MKNSTIIKLIALNRQVTVSEETFTVKELKRKYPKLWMKSQGDYQVFINFCLEKWGNEIESPWNVVSYCLE
jgi:hypothetical protein